MLTLFKKLKFAAGIAVIGNLLTPSMGLANDDVLCIHGRCIQGVHIAEDTICFDGFCTYAPPPGKSNLSKDGIPQGKLWTPELGEVQVDQYTDAELRKMMDDFWTPERMRNAEGVLPRVPCGDLKFEGAETICHSATMETRMNYWTPKRVKEATVVELQLPNGLVKNALIANDNALEETPSPLPQAILKIQQD